MDTNKILSADWLDLLFDGRNKTYGAYDLRKTYTSRVVKSILLTAGIVTLVFTGTVLASSLKPEPVAKPEKIAITLQSIAPDKVKEPDPEPKQPEPVKKAAPDVQPRIERFTTPVITDNPQQPPPTQDDLAGAVIDVRSSPGGDDPHIQMPTGDAADGKGLLDVKKDDESNEPFEKVEKDAQFDGWTKFLYRNLNASIPIDNDAPPGRYTVMIQFVVDVDGSVSDIRALTNVGYGMEKEAIRVLKKANKWIPAIQNGRQVKAYRRQPITFEVMND